MKNQRQWAALLCIIFLSCTWVHPVTPEEVSATIQRFDDSWKNKHPASVDSLLAPAYLYFTQSGSIFTRDSILQTAGSPEYQLTFLQRDILSTQIDGNAAVANTRWIGQGIYRGKAFSDTQRCSVMLVKIRDTLRILAEHCTLEK